MAEVLEELEAATLTEDEKLIVYAACEGDHELAQALDDVGDQPLPVPPAAHPGRELKLAGAYLTAIGVEGFRGIGARMDLDLTPGPGLTVVAGRNGSGKSSFAEAAEIALTGSNQRWAQARGDWRRGWRNLHHDGPCAIDVRMLIEGAEEPETTVHCRWPSDAEDVDEAAVTVQRKGGKRREYDELGWREPMESFRPFLSYKELGSLTDNPSTMFDKLSVILGIGVVTAAVERLRGAVKERTASGTQEKAHRAELQALLRQAVDPRATQALELIKPRTPDLDAVAALASPPTEPADDELEALRELAQLPDFEESLLAEGIRELRQVAADQPNREAERDLELAELLEQALAVHDDHGLETCPVCGQGTLDAAWSEKSRRSAADLRQRAEPAVELRRRRTGAVLRARAALPLLDPLLTLSIGDQQLRDQVRQLRDHLPDDPTALADRLERDRTVLATMTNRVRGLAADELARRESDWRPLTESLLAWVSVARQARAAAPMVTRLKTCEKWLKGVEEKFRNARLAPIAEAAARIWAELRQESNVELGALELVGTTTRRRLKIDVSVDGASAPHAVSVMSQGELNALALSIFLPRATVAASPFRFLIIDDPVQAMDPAKVDGLARVLATVAEQRQVIVFTHDDRLPDAIRRLNLPAEILQVRRRSGSAVTVARADAPAHRHLSDARALLADKQVSPVIAAALVPGILRQAVEAACQVRIRRTRLAAGDPYSDVEARLAEVRRLISMLAFCWFGDPDKGADVPAYLKRQSHLRRCSDMSHTARLLNRGAHGELVPAMLPALLSGATELVTFIEGSA